MIINILLIIDFVMLAIVVSAYIYASMRERKFLRSEANQSLELQQKVYQAQVLKEINDRIGYSLDTGKIVDIITSSLGNLLEYDTVSYMVLEPDGKALFKCHVEKTVTHDFIEQVKHKMLMSYEAILNQAVAPKAVDESITGNILDDSLRVEVQSFFNLPVVISEKLVGLINVASSEKGRYGAEQASILYTITNQAATAVSKLQSLLESEKGKLAAVIYSLADGVITVDLTNQLTVYNPALKGILGIVTEKPLTMFDIVDSLAGKVDIRTKIEQAIAEDKPIAIPEVLLKDKALELTIASVKNSEGEIIGASVVFHDITTEKALEKLRQEFTAMMVHELRAPLTAVRWSSESLLKNLSAASGVEPAKVKDTVLTIETASNNMLELVNDLLDVAKIEAGKFELNMQEYDIVELINEQAKAFKPQAEIKHLAINVTAPEKYSLKFDRVRIGQVLSNLISNSIKYTDSGQIEINLSVNAEEKTATVYIKDSGIGVSREDLGQLFSKFKQLRGSEHARKGTGLGLVVSKGIIDAHGGKIWAESAGENLGSTFAFSLPLNK
ncbi:MAG: PAS domain-containing protein [Candidatus Doudnabacteria bacterium]|nr:PAS domain-containing protein [Candidatus Doudnabacteria bacterium]